MGRSRDGRGGGALGLAAFPPRQKDPKVAKIASECAAGRACPQAGNFNQKRGFFHPKKVLSQRLRVVPGEGEVLLNRFPRIFPQSEGMEEQVWGMGGWCCLSPLPTVTVPKPPRFAPKWTIGFKKRLKN